MKKYLFLSAVIFFLAFYGCDAPSPFTWHGDYQKNNDVYDMMSTVVGSIEAEAEPAKVTTVDDRVVISALVKNPVGRVMKDVPVTFTTDTGFFRSDEYGPSEIFTTATDSEGMAYAHLLKVARTCTVKIEAGGYVVHVVVSYD